MDNLATAITKPKETVEAISKSAKETVEKDYIQGNAYSRSYVEGKVLFGVGATIVGTKGLGSLTKVGKVPDVPNIKASKLEKTPVVKNETQVDGVKGTGNDEVTYRRVQGGDGTKSSQTRIQVNDDGTLTIPNKKADLNISIDNGEHSNYFKNEVRGGNADIIEFTVPKWFDEFLKENTIPQAGYKSNPLNQGRTAPKLVDPTKPGNSFEVPAPWVEWIEEYAKNARVRE
ncbi:hypothetical protein R6U77_00055 [Lysinibacillus louembei]|uniref:Pre-toxin TG domain-containing protein n=1 Tax=Lysinibacillus louembei TaxID=1470088 RepID=A0ABZ0RXA6_9BACI|nr:hypothetical protein [Lysinibacillus louembei]WPK12115.1 hypothetical protein R6U77_00055 [Lysinibacillus louembei]